MFEEFGHLFFPEAPRGVSPKNESATAAAAAEEEQEEDDEEEAAEGGKGGTLRSVNFEEKCTVQSTLTLTESDLRTGGFIVCPGTHVVGADGLLPGGVRSSRGRRVDGFGVDYKHVPMTAGSLVLWDSRAVHASEPGLYMAQRSEEETELLRVAVPVCMVPRTANEAGDSTWRRRYAAPRPNHHARQAPRRPNHHPPSSGSGATKQRIVRGTNRMCHGGIISRSTGFPKSLHLPRVADWRSHVSSLPKWRWFSSRY